jgi:Tol biopolymer transport system component
MPYVEGESLRERLDREHQLPVDEAVEIARNVAEALDYAHSHGVIHRDIKPANILLQSGKPVVSDFGIALAVDTAGGGRLTETGLSLGTPHYMSPEQATGDLSVRPATDIYALACVLYEMLVGDPPYVGSTARAILGKIVTGEPEAVTKHRRSVPANVDGAIRRALEKVPADRFASAKALADALADPGFRHAVGVAADAGGVVRKNSPTFGLAAAAVVLALAAVWGWLRPTTGFESSVTTRSRLTGLDVGSPVGWRLAISRDGRWFAAAGTEQLGSAGPGRSSLHLRSADDIGWREVPDTRGARDPSFSPDGQDLAFVGGGTIFRVPVTGGPILPVADGEAPHWGVDNTIVYQGPGNALYRVAASGGEPELLFASDTLRVYRPHRLPNGRAVVFGTGTALDSRIVLFEMETGEARELLAAGTQPRYVPTGHLIYGGANRTSSSPGGGGNSALMGVPFDLRTLETSGSPVTLLPELAVVDLGAANFAISDTGTLIYSIRVAGQIGGLRTLVEVSLDGVESPFPLAPAGVDAPRYSPGGDEIAYSDRDRGELHIYDVVTGASPVFVSGFGYPEWSPSGEHLYFSQQSPESDGYRRPVDGREGAIQLWSRRGGEYVLDVSAGDSIIVVRENSPDLRDRNLLLVRLAGDSAQFEDFVATESAEVNGTISSDGRWIAYQSEESGEPRIYVNSFPVLTGRRSIPGPGADPVWSPDDRVLYYRDGSRFMAIDVSTEPDFTLRSAPRLLFDRPEYAQYQNPGPRRNWDLHPDGSRFVTVKSLSGRGSPLQEVYVATNWFTELRQRMGG